MLLYLRHGVEFLLSIQGILWTATVAAELLLVVRLVRERLVRTYPLFTAFLAADAISLLVAMQVDFKKPGYAEVFRLCTAVLLVFRTGFAAELYERICGHFPGIGKFRIGLAAALISLAGLVAALTFRPNLAGRWAFPQTTVTVIQRFQGEIFAGASFLTWIFLRLLHIRQPFRPNVQAHWRIATVYFAVSGAAHLAGLATRGGRALIPINCAMFAADLACFVAWFRLMRRSGEQLPSFERLSPDQIHAVEQYNRELLETVRSLPVEISGRK